jgi:hypothetical protein
LEQLDQVPGRVGEQDLSSSGAGDHVAAEGQACVTEPVDFGIEVLENEVDPVAAYIPGVMRGRPRA